MDFTIATRIEGEVAVISPSGELDATTSPGFAAALDELLSAAAPPKGIIVDLADVEFCDSRCIGVLVASYRQARDLGIGLALAAPQRAVYRLFMIAGIDQILTIEEDMADAEKAVLE